MSNDTSAQSGRSKAMAHRKARVSGKKPAHSVSANSPAPRSTNSTVRRPAATGPVQVAEGREAARQKRRQQIEGKPASSGSASTPPQKGKRGNKPEPVIEPRSQSKPKNNGRKNGERRNAVKTDTVGLPSGRKQSMAWRQARYKGKSGQNAFQSRSSHSGSLAKAANPDASTREIAKQVRAERCTRGKNGCRGESSSSAQRTRKMRSRPAPEKVATSETLSGQSVSGTQVGQGKLTGAESGACQLVSGTEYLGSEEFTTHCGEAPQPGHAKVTQTQTQKGQTISGNELGQSESVTGDRSGACAAVTGTDYLPADQSQLFCGTEKRPAKPRPAKGFSTPEPKKSSGKVTGGDSYVSQSTTIRPKNKQAPEKVVLSQTFGGNATTGTQVGRTQAVTGDERGFCQSVTGTGYQGKEEVEQKCDTPSQPAPPKKVLTSETLAGQRVTGDRSGQTSGMTGSEAGTCQAVTGTPYMSAEQSASCSPQERSGIESRTRQTGLPNGKPLSGIQPGPQGLTGAQKGACELVSGTPYQGLDQTSAMCRSSDAAQPGESDFPQMIQSGASVEMAPAPDFEVEPPRSAITGDGWDRGTKVTGTEGPWANQRNTSVRSSFGAQSPMAASQYRPHTMEPVPQSPITGSSGNTETGAKVTLSGGARA